MKFEHLARPAGSRPAAVYWRRRFVLLAVLVLAVWLLARACGTSGSPESRAASGRPPAAGSAPAAASSSHSPAPSPAGTETSPPAATSPTAQPSSTNSAAAGATPAPGGPGSQPVAAGNCDLSTLTLRAAVNKSNFRRPFQAAITLQVATRATDPCQLDPSSVYAQVLEGSHVVWSSKGCDAAAPPSSADQTPLEVPTEAAAAQHYTWSGSACGGPLPAGRYDVVGRLGLAQAYAGTVTVS